MLSKQASGAAKILLINLMRRSLRRRNTPNLFNSRRWMPMTRTASSLAGELPKDAGLTVSGTVSGDLADALTGSTYSITETGSAGEYTVTATIPGINGGNPITLGTLTLEQNGEDGDLSYTFTPNQGEDGLQNIPQGMDLSIQIPLKVKDNHGVLSEGTHTATINIEGTNDRPSISVEGAS